MAEIPTIPEFYSGQKIFVTGGTGFMGKVLIEKLLRSCPDLDTIYLLIRPKKGKLPQDRIEDLTKQKIFNILRQSNPRAFEKLRAISGDVQELNLGLSKDDKELLEREVSIVFHSAASVRFTDPVNESVLMNVRGTREVVHLALGMKQLKVFLHLSTAFSNVCEHGHAVEKIYPPPRGWDWKMAIKMAEREGTNDFVDCLTPKILGPLTPNSYVFTKALAEQIIYEYRDKLPIVIVRPSIVIGMFDEPNAGWSDNLNGPYGMWIAVYAGFISSLYSMGSISLDYVPVDVAVKSMIVIAWHRAISQRSITSDLPVYNCTTMWEYCNQDSMHKIMAKVAEEYPTNKSVWYTKCVLTESWTRFQCNMVLFHLPFSYLMDELLKYKGEKTMFVKTCQRIYVAIITLKTFFCINFTFDNKEFLRLADDMLPSDRKEFDYTKVWKKDQDTIKTVLVGMRVNVLQDPIETLPQAKQRFARLYWFDKLATGAFYSALFWALSTTSTFHSIAALITG